MIEPLAQELAALLRKEWEQIAELKATSARIREVMQMIREDDPEKLQTLRIAPYAGNGYAGDPTQVLPRIS